MNETCGCCEGVEAVTPLSTANRPGLEALSYRVGTHATFLETMIARLSSAEYPALGGLTTRAANDPSIALLDAWATVADVLTFYQERIANEGYLRTATERRSILELARLVGYVPRPGVAASVYLALTLEDEYRTEIPAGTRAQSLPGPGELPQFFETSEALEARSEWNVLTPRLSRPQSLRPITPPGDDTPRGRLYLKGVSTNLGPNDPLLVESGLARRLIKVRTVEPDPERDRTLVTFTLPRPSTVISTRPGIEDIRQRVEGLLDLEAHRVSPESETTRRVVGLLEDLQTRLTPETPPEAPADSLRETVLPGVRQDLSTARERNYTRLTPWLERIEGELQRIESELASSRLGVARASGGAVSAFSNRAEVNGRLGEGNAPSATLDGLLDRLGKPPSVQPVSAAKLSRSLAKSFGTDSDLVPQLLSALRPDLGRALYQAWEQTGTEPSPVSIYALRVTAAPFGHNAPPRAILRDGEIQRYEEWTLERTTQVTGQPFEVTITVSFDFEGPAAIQIDVTLEDETRRHGPQVLTDHRFQLAFTRAGELVAGTISDVEGDRFSLTLAFRNSAALVQVRDRVDGGVVIGIRRDEAEPTTRIRVDITKDDEFEVIGESSDPINVTVGRDDRQNRQIVVSGEIQASSTEPTEQPDVVSLDATYKEILPESWVVVERPDPDEEGTLETVIARAEQVREASRADYGITAKGTQITLSENWLYPNRDDFAVIRGTSVYAAPELLELADAPPEVIDENGVVRVEPVAGGRIELDALYDGLEPGRWLFVTGERDDLPGVRASELVMLAGVEQGVRLVSLTDENLPRVGEATALRLTGRGSTGPGGLDLTISARRAADGSVSGYAHLVGGATGEVVGIAPPDDERDFWCINVRRIDTGPNSGDQRINWYVRDAGDGITSFDEISYITSIGGDCESLSAPTGSWLRLVKGDFHVSAEEPTGEKVHSTIILAGDLAYPYKRETVRIHGNVVNATHGETRPEVLG
ncbi:MAG TPA: hypothetical protein VHM69_08970, partial [Rubrobacter sp.]|nr:hypothetical protein [Rubrobacter sp.]